MISASHIYKTFNGQSVLGDLSLKVPDGETVSLIGPSGCGKSTLLRIIIGLVKAERGTIEFGGQELNEGSVQNIRHNTGYVIQEGGLFPHLTNRENITLTAGYLGWEKEKIEKRLDELLSLVNIEASLLDRKPGQISGGQRQRISLMRALMLDPGYILLDEPLGSIDPLVRYELQKDLRQIFRKLNKTVILVTHDLGEAAYLGDKIALMQAGKIVQQGNIKDIMNNPASRFVEDFITAQRSPLEELG